MTVTTVTVTTAHGGPAPVRPPQQRAAGRAELPAMFRSEAALAAAVDAAFADALAEEMATALRTEIPAAETPGVPARAFGLPSTEVLIAQAGIVTGPAPRGPSPTAQHAKTAARVGGGFACRAAWWLLKTTAWSLREILSLAWQLVVGPAPRDVPPPMLPSDFLAATSQEIVRRGWTQRTRQDSYGQVCMLGAELALIKEGTGTLDTAHEANDHLLAVTGARSVPRWNDHLRRQEEQVHAALLAAAARARAAGQ